MHCDPNKWTATHYRVERLESLFRKILLHEDKQYEHEVWTSETSQVTMKIVRSTLYEPEN